MKVKVIVFFFLAILFSFYVINLQAQTESNYKNRNVIQYLLKYTDTSTKLNLYNASHNLLYPLHVASLNQTSELAFSFRKFFGQRTISASLGGKYELEQLNFAYFYAEYLRLLPSLNGDRNKFEELKNYVLNYWQNEVGNVWSTEGINFKGKRSRILYLLTTDYKLKPKEKYLLALTDFDMLAMSIGTSLAVIERNSLGFVSKELLEIVTCWDKVFKKNVVFVAKDRWLLQPGVWAEYPDYRYAGFSCVEEVKLPKIVSQIGFDVSHFSQMPGFLETLIAYFSFDPLEKSFFTRLSKGLADQFLYSVVKRPQKSSELYRFKNYMDGTNGLYRYNYYGIGTAHGPYQNPKHIFYGWWKLLKNNEIDHIYQQIAFNFDAYFNHIDYRLDDRDINDSKAYYKEIVEMKLKN
jgi:hypothetical protein